SCRWPTAPPSQSVRAPLPRRRSLRARPRPPRRGDRVRSRPSRSEPPEPRGDPDQRGHRVVRYPIGLIIHEPADRPPQALLIRQGGDPPEPRPCLLGAVFEVSTEEPRAVTGDPRRPLREQQALAELEREATVEGVPERVVPGHAGNPEGVGQHV